MNRKQKEIAKLISYLGMDKSAMKLFEIVYKYDKERKHDEMIDRLRVLMNTEYLWIFEKIEQGQCPFCGKQFNSIDDVLTHIKRRDRGKNICFYATAFLIFDLIRGYSTILEMIEWKRHKHNVRYFVKLTGKWYNNFEEAYHALKERIISSMQRSPNTNVL